MHKNLNILFGYRGKLAAFKIGSVKDFTVQLASFPKVSVNANINDVSE